MVGDVALHRGDHRQEILTGAAVDRDDEAGAAVDAIAASDVGEAVAHLPQIADGEDEPVGERDEGELGYVLADILLVLATQEDLAALAANRAAGEFEILAADDLGHLLKREAIFTERCLRDLDRDLVALGSADVGRRHGGEGEEILANPLRHIPEPEFVAIRRHAADRPGFRRPEDADLDRRRAERHLLYLRILGERGETRDPLYLRADLTDHPLHVLDGVSNLENAVAEPFSGDAGDLLDARHAPAGFLDLLADPLLHLRRRRARIWH